MVETTAVTRALDREFMQIYPGEATRRLETLSAEQAADILMPHPVKATLPVWERISPDSAVAILSLMPSGAAAALLNELEPASSTSFLSHLKTDQREQLLAGVKPARAKILRLALQYPQDTAGSLMEPQLFRFRPEMTVGQSLSRLRSQKRRGMRVIFVVDGNNRLMGQIEVQEMAFAGADAQLADLVVPVAAVVPVTAGRQEIVQLLEQHRLSDIPVLDTDGRLAGIVRYDALVRAVEDEASAKLQMMVGVSKEERALSKIGFAVRKRLPWLQINLLTAFLAAAVVGLFEATIAKYTALAVLLPVVAGQSGNTGAQALAVTMRGLALREITALHWPKILWKESNVAFFNGVAVALTTSLGVWAWSGSIGLASVIGASMILSMVIAGIAGAATPILLTVLGQDPAQSSSIILTTVTDVAGFFSFLGIATLMSAFL
ncbi:MAG: magnesium transporter [Gammaproteobacteria bacterium]|nr:magnesium transporter [Gammaproteobacteria bacterium]